MKDFGYMVRHNDCRTEDEYSFIQKAVFDYQNSKCTEV